MLSISKNLNSSQRNVEAMKEMIERNTTPGINLKSSESENESKTKKKDYLKKKRGLGTKINNAPTPDFKNKIINKDELKVYDEVMNLKVSQAELTKLVVNVVHFINKLEKKWLGTPEEEEEEDIKDKNIEDEKEKENGKIEKEDINSKENAVNEESQKEKKTKSRKKRIFKRAPKQSQFLKRMQIEDLKKEEEIEEKEEDWKIDNAEIKEDEENLDISQLEIFKSWHFFDSVSDLNKSAAIVAGSISNEIKNQVVQTFNPDEINKEKNALVNQTVQEISYKAKRDYEKEIQEKIKKELENFNKYIKEKEKELNEKSNLVTEILKKSAFQPLVDEMKDMKEAIEAEIKVAKIERVNKEEEIKKWLEVLEKIYTQDKEKFDILKKEIDKKENIGLNEKISKDIEKVNKEILNKINEEIRKLESKQIEFLKNNLDYHVNRENELYNLVSELKEGMINNKMRIDKLECNENKIVNFIGSTNENENIKNFMMNLQNDLRVNQKENRNILDKALEIKENEVNKDIEKNKLKLEEFEKKILDLDKKIIYLTNMENEKKFELNKKEELEKISKLDIEWREKINNLKSEIEEKYEKKIEKIKKDILENKTIVLSKELLAQMGGKNPKDNGMNEKIIRIEEEIKYLKEKNENIKYDIKNIDFKIQLLNQEIASNKTKKESKNQITINPEIKPKVEVKIENDTRKDKEDTNKYLKVKLEDLNTIEENCIKKINVLRDNLLKEIKNLEKKFEENFENLDSMVKKDKKEILKKNEEVIEGKLEEIKLEDLKRNIIKVKNQIETINLDLDLLKKKEENVNEWRIKIETDLNNVKRDLLIEKEKSALDMMNEKIKNLEKNTLDTIKKKMEIIKKDLLKKKEELELGLKDSIIKVLPKIKKEEEVKKLKEFTKEKKEEIVEKKEMEEKDPIKKDKKKEEKEEDEKMDIIEEIIKEEKDSFCTRENCEYCRKIEENVKELSKMIKELSDVQAKFMKEYKEEAEFNMINEKEKKEKKNDEDEEEEEEDENEDKKNIEKKLKDIEDRIENLENKEESEEKSEDSKNLENKDINMEKCRNIKDLNKKLIKKNYIKNNDVRRNELLKVKDLLKKYWININNQIMLKKETLNNIDDEKIIKGFIEKEDNFIKRRKLKNKKWEKIKIIEKESKDIWKLYLKEDMNLRIFKDKEGDICIYNEEEEEVIKKYCGYCLEDTHERRNCWNILKMVNCVNINWEETQIKENICCLCGGFHAMDNINNIKKLKCPMMNKIIEIVLYMTCDTKKSYEKFELIKDKKKEFLKEIDNIFIIIEDNFELIVKNVDNEEKLDNNWFKSVTEIMKFIKLGYKLWNMKGKNINNRIVRRKEIKSFKILGKSNKKKEIIAEMYNFLKKIDFLKPEIDITQKDCIKWKRSIKEKGIELKNNMLIKIYWKLLEINLVWKINEVLFKNQDVDVYINKENNLFKRIFNKLFIGNILKDENNLNIKKALARQIQKLKDKRNEKDINDMVNRLIEEIKDLENKDFKGKIIRKENKEEIPMLNINDYINNKEEEIVEKKNKKIWLDEDNKEKKKKIKKKRKKDDKEEEKNKTEVEEKEVESIKKKKEIKSLEIDNNIKNEKEIKEEKKSNSLEIKRKEKKKEYSEDKKEEDDEEKKEIKKEKEEEEESEDEDDDMI